MTGSDLNIPFDPLSWEEWKSQVEKELKGKSYNEFLTWTNDASITIESWQNTLPETLADLPSVSEPWKILEPIYEQDAKQANDLALNALNQGAEAIWFQKSFKGAAAEVAVKGIDQNIAPVFIQKETLSDPFEVLLKTGDAKIFKDHRPLLINGKRLRERGANELLELAALMSQCIEVCDKYGYDSDITILTSIGTNYLTEIAKLRALRWIWNSILKQNSVDAPVKAIAINLTNNYAQNDEHTNILRASSAAMSAVVGGANYLMIQPWDAHWKAPNDFSARISRNIQVLLKEESHMDKNTNAADGAYFIENLTTEMAKKAWDMIQCIEQNGGFSEYAKSKQLFTDIEHNASQLMEAYSKEKALLGVNKFLPREVNSETAPKSSTYELLPSYLSIPHQIQLMHDE